MPVRRRQADRKLERGVDPFERENKGDRDREDGPLGRREPEPQSERDGCNADGELDPRIALRAQDVRNAVDGVSERLEHTGSLGLSAATEEVSCRIRSG